MPSNNVLNTAPSLNEAIVRRGIRDVVARKIAALIASRVLQIGDELPSERELAAALQVSRESVRGGIQILSARGVISVIHGARTRVVSDAIDTDLGTAPDVGRINAYSLDDVHAARLLVERPVVAQAAQRIGQETLDLLNESLKSQRTALQDPVRFLIADREFHLAVYNACGNPALADFVGDLYGYMLDHRRRAVALPGAIARSYADHQAIFRALKKHDSATAALAIETHVRRIYQTTVAVLEGR